MATSRRDQLHACKTNCTTVAYLLPATPLQPNLRRSAKAHSRRPRPPSSARCPCRRSPTALADGPRSSGDGKGDENTEENDTTTPNLNDRARQNAWSGISVWFARREPPVTNEDDEATSTNAPEQSAESQVTSPPPRRGPPPQITVIPDLSASAPEEPSQPDGFRWPWYRYPGIAAPQEGQPERGSEQTKPAQTEKIRVTHSDTKPGSMLGVDPNDARVKPDPTLQNRWKKVMNIFGSNPVVDEKRSDKQRRPWDDQQPTVSDSKHSNRPSTDRSENEIRSDSSSLANRRGRGIKELYSPPSPSASVNEDSEKMQQPWFGVPWKRDSQGKIDELSAGSGDEKPEAAETSDMEERTEMSSDRQVDESADSEAASSGEKRATADANTSKSWFTPPWARDEAKQRAGEKETSLLESDISTSAKGSSSVKQKNNTSSSRLGKIEIEANEDSSNADDERDMQQPREKGWFRWPKAQPETNKKITEVIDTAAREVVETEGDEAKANSNGVRAKNNIIEVEEDVNTSETKQDSVPQEKVEKEREPIVAAGGGKSSAQPNTKGSTADMVSIPQRDVAAIRLIFGSETFFATEALSAPGGLIFRGNLRGEPKATLIKLEQRLKARLGDKYTLCLAEGEEDLRPVVVVVPTARDRRASTPRQKAMAVVIGLMTMSTCLGRGMAVNLLRPRIIANYGPAPINSLLDRILFAPVTSSVAVAVAIALLVLASQLVQRAVASRHRTRVAIPYVLPSYQLGSFGTVVQLASPTPTRAALFDIAMSGAMMLVVPSVICLIIGLRLSTQFASVVPVPMSVVSNSMLMGVLTRQIPSGQILVDYARSLIGLHPLAVIGANCLTIAAFNLLPMRQLDGGRIISALYGRKTAVQASRVTVLFLLLATSKNPSLIVFLLAVMLGPWHVDRPAKNELTEPDALRTLLGYAMMLLMVAILLPYPRSAFFGTL